MRAQDQAKGADDGAAKDKGVIDPTKDGFRPVTNADRQMQSGEMLLVEAYACFWLIAFVLILLTWRKQRALDGRVKDLEAALAKAARTGGKR